MGPIQHPEESWRAWKLHVLEADVPLESGGWRVRVRVRDGVSTRMRS